MQTDQQQTKMKQIEMSKAIDKLQHLASQIVKLQQEQASLADEYNKVLYREFGLKESDKMSKIDLITLIKRMSDVF